MPKPLMLRHDQEKLRLKIEASKLIDKIQEFALARALVVADGIAVYVDPKDESRRIAPMSKDQLTAAKLLLERALPTLTSTEVSGEVTRTYVLRAPEPAQDAEEWLKQFGPKTIEHQ